MIEEIVISEYTESSVITTAGLVWAPTAAISPSVYSLDGTVSIDTTYQIIRIKSSSGAVKMSALPCIEDPGIDGIIRILFGTDDTNYIEIPDESDVIGNGMRLRYGQNCILGKNDSLPIMWDALQSKWIETMGGRVDSY